MIERLKNLQIPILASSCPLEINESLNLLGAVITKTVTLNPIEGRVSDLWFSNSNNELHSLNSMGLPNLGIKKFCEIMLPRYLALNVPFVISVSLIDEEVIGFLDILFAYLSKIDQEKILGIELNISCPNIVKSNLSWSRIDLLCDKIKSFNSNFLMFVKLQYSTCDSTIRSYRNCNYDVLNCFNTYPIHYQGKGYGLGGSSLKQMYAKRIEEIRSFIDLPIIATGGITCSQDIINYFVSGANLVSVASYFLEDHKNIERLIWDFLD